MRFFILYGIKIHCIIVLNHCKMNSILSFNVWLLWLIYMYNLMYTIIESVLKLGLFRVCVGFSSGNVWEEKTLSNVWKPFSPLCGLKCWSSCLSGDAMSYGSHVFDISPLSLKGGFVVRVRCGDVWEDSRAVSYFVFL